MKAMRVLTNGRNTPHPTITTPMLVQGQCGINYTRQAERSAKPAETILKTSLLVHTLPDPLVAHVL